MKQTQNQSGKSIKIKVGSLNRSLKFYWLTLIILTKRRHKSPKSGMKERLPLHLAAIKMI